MYLLGGLVLTLPVLAVLALGVESIGWIGTTVTILLNLLVAYDDVAFGIQLLANSYNNKLEGLTLYGAGRLVLDLYNRKRDVAALIDVFHILHDYYDLEQESTISYVAVITFFILLGVAIAKFKDLRNDLHALLGSADQQPRRGINQESLSPKPAVVTRKWFPW